MHANVDHDEFRIPDEIARTIMTADQWDQVEEVIYPAGSWLRQNMPIGRGHTVGYDPVWIISKYHHVKEILKDLETYHSGDDNFMLVSQEGDDYLRTLLNGSTSPIDNLTPMDPPLHTDHRALQAPLFTIQAIRKFEDAFRSIAQKSVDHFFATDGRCDAVAELTHYYPLRTIMEMIDVSDKDFPHLEKLAREAFGGDDPDIVGDSEAGNVSPETAARLWLEAVGAFYDYFEAMVKDRHTCPRDDIATGIVCGRLPNGEQMTPKRQNHMLASLAIAGHDTVNSSLAGGLLGFCRHPEQLRIAKSRPELIPAVVEEAIRYATPTKHFMRTATRDIDFHGVRFSSGDRIMLLLFSANMDEDIYDQPESFNIERKRNPHVAFGFGRHVCLGMHIARIEMQVLFEELLPRLTSIELDGPFQRKRGNFVTSIKKLPVRFTSV